MNPRLPYSLICSVQDLDSIRSVDPDSESGSGSRRTKMTHKNVKFHVLKCWRAEGFSCSLDVLYEEYEEATRRINKLKFLIKKYL
jgi:hypothetical protein